MTEQKHRNPPIAEAILDLRVELSQEISTESLKLFHEGIKKEFPDSEEIFRFQGGFQFAKGGQSGVQQTHQHIGYSYKPQDNTKVVQVRTDGFTFNKLRPYEGWDSLQPQAQALWDRYFEIAKPKRIIRLALRYINRISLPTTMGNLSEYLQTKPHVSSEVPQNLEGYFMRLMVSDKQSDSKAFIVQMTENPTDEATVPFILDIDAFHMVDLTENSKKIWDVFLQLRHFKNQMFDGSFTKRGLELFS